jgi:hypothetical protein
MKKRRVTLNLDEDVVEALESIQGRSISSTANDALRGAIAVEAHRAALLRWLDSEPRDHGRRPGRRCLRRADRSDGAALRTCCGSYSDVAVRSAARL